MARFFKNSNKNSISKRVRFLSYWRTILIGFLGLSFLGMAFYFFPHSKTFGKISPISQVSNSAFNSPTSTPFRKCLAESAFTEILNTPKQGFTELSGEVAQVSNSSDKAVTLATQADKSVLIPASTEKVVTGAIAISLLGPEKTFTTKVLDLGEGKILLVGGGDPYLLAEPDIRRAKAPSLKNLAEQSAAALRAAGKKSVELYWDDSLFTGANWHPDWSDGYRDYMNPVTALSISAPFGTYQEHYGNPTAVAVSAFAKALKAQDIDVVVKTKLIDYPASATQLAKVESLPLAELMPLYLLPSDNWKAEIIARHIAIAKGFSADFDGVKKAMTQVLQEWQIWDEGANIADGSGLSRQNRVSANMLVQILAKIWQNPKAISVATGFPISGVNGTLKNRFKESALTKEAKGLVHAKTGNLPGVSSLSGYYYANDGSLIVFALIANNVGNIDDTRNWLDNAVAKLVKSKC